MLRRGIARATRRRYFGSLHSLYLSGVAADIAATDPFERVREAADVADVPGGLSDDALLKGVRVVAARCQADGASAQTARIFMYMLYGAGVAVDTVMSLKFDMPRPQNPRMAEIVDSQRVGHARRQYVFDLGQGRRRPAQIARELDAALCRAGLAWGVFAGTDTAAGQLKTVWAALARRAGLTPVEIRAVIGNPPRGCTWLSVVPAAEIDDTQRSAALCRVADMIDVAAPRWHVMRLRRGVAPDDIYASIGDAGVSYFYPMRRVAVREGRKLTFHDEPFLPGVLFFRARPDRVAELVARVGDKAWCYRTVNTPGSPYAVIPDGEMERFSRFTGCLAPDTEVALADPGALGPGTRVRITGGVMEGYEGVVYGRDADNLTFALRLTADTALKWTVAVPADMIEPIGPTAATDRQTAR